MAGPVRLQVKWSGYRWVVVGLWLVCGVTGFMVVSTLGLLLPSVSAELRILPGQQGLLGSAAFWGTLVLAVPLGWWTSRYGPKNLTTITMVLGTLLLFLQGRAPGFSVLLVGRVAFGMSMLAREPARALLVQQWFAPREIILVQSVANALFGIVVGGGLLATPYILSGVGDNWRGVLYVFGSLYALLTVLWMVLGRERAAREQRSRESPKEAGLLRRSLSHRDLWIGGFGFVGVNMTFAAFLSFYPTLMLQEYAVSLRWSGAVLALATLIGGFAGLGVGYVVMAMDKQKAMLFVLGILMTGSYVGMVLVGSVAPLVVLAVINGIGWGFWPILHTVPFHLPGIRPREVAVALAFTVTAISAGTVLGPLVTGYLQEATGDLRLALLIVSFGPLSMTAAGLLLRLGTGAASAVSSDAPHGA